jgi:hypothetical protein
VASSRLVTIDQAGKQKAEKDVAMESILNSPFLGEKLRQKTCFCSRKVSLFCRLSHRRICT